MPLQSRRVIPGHRDIPRWNETAPKAIPAPKALYDDAERGSEATLRRTDGTGTLGSCRYHAVTKLTCKECAKGPGDGHCIRLESS